MATMLINFIKIFKLGPDVSLKGSIQNKAVYEIAKTFSDRVNKGEVEAKHGTEEPKSDSPY